MHRWTIDYYRRYYYSIIRFFKLPLMGMNFKGLRKLELKKLSLCNGAWYYDAYYGLNVTWFTFLQNNELSFKELQNSIKSLNSIKLFSEIMKSYVTGLFLFPKTVNRVAMMTCKWHTKQNKTILKLWISMKWHFWYMLPKSNWWIKAFWYSFISLI